jgi:hypothetical protein
LISPSGNVTKAREITVTYPFHPLAKQSLVVLSEHEHFGTIHLLVRSGDGTTHLFPSWMASPEADAIEVVTIPRLFMVRLFELRRFLDQNMIALSSERQVSAARCKHGEVEGISDKSVREPAKCGRAILAVVDLALIEPDLYFASSLQCVGEVADEGLVPPPANRTIRSI